MAGPRVAVVADDLIWSTRLRDRLAAAGAEVIVVRGREALESRLPELDGAVVDLTARAYDGIELVGMAASAGRRVVAVAQHDDHDARRRAREAGAERVFAYRQLSDDVGLLTRWLAAGPFSSGEAASAASQARGS